jgi:hypothetical protein
MVESAQIFLLRNPEKSELNQYWFSHATIDAMVKEVCQHGPEATALVSTPSVYFSLPAAVREKCKVFDLDEKFAYDPGYVRYDFNNPTHLPGELEHSFDMVVIDPPFITREVWEK